MRVFRSALAVVVLTAIAVQFHAETGRAGFEPVNFFSFFTIVCNMFGAVVLLGVSAGAIAKGHVRDVLRGAATLYLTIVGVVFSLLLARLESVLIPWVNAVVHYLMPIAIVLDWCADPPRTTLTLRDIGAWLPLPALYVVYTLVRGAIVHWYPYPFLNVDAIGYAGVGVYVASILLFTLVVAYGVTVIGNTLRERRKAGAL